MSVHFCCGAAKGRETCAVILKAILWPKDLLRRVKIDLRSRGSSIINIDSKSKSRTRSRESEISQQILRAKEALQDDRSHSI